MIQTSETDKTTKMRDDQRTRRKRLRPVKARPRKSVEKERYKWRRTEKRDQKQDQERIPRKEDEKEDKEGYRERERTKTGKIESQVTED